MSSLHEFEDMYTEYSDQIYRFLYWQTSDSRLAEDLTSEVFMKAWRSRDSFTTGSKKAWLYRIARNIVIDYWRKKHEIITEDMDEIAFYDDKTAERLDREAEVKLLNGALAKLPEKLRQVVTLRFLEKLPAKEVAKIFETTEGNVRLLQYRALRKLKGLLKDYEDRR